jgi:wyosine [tRNA(Phe)-imidazoG37] synthetase (radical SAM superfamily)
MKHVYGPVPSRRLGQSLGVDLVPKKVCTYDCIYCQVGKTTRLTLEQEEYVSAADILHDVHAVLSEREKDLDYIACSGSGEPCLNSAIGKIIRGIKEMTAVPIAVITNSSLLSRQEVREALLPADCVMPSLDAATPNAFQKINRPHPAMQVAEIIEGLTAFRSAYRGQLWLEILLCQGINDSEEEIEAMRAAIRRIRPDRVQLNTVVRPALEAHAVALTREQMEQVKNVLGDGVEIIADFTGMRHAALPEKIEERIIRIVERRPMTADDLARVLSLGTEEITKIVDKLIAQGKLKPRSFNQRLYYEIDTGEPSKKVS